MSRRSPPRKNPLRDSITGIKDANIYKLAKEAGITKLSAGENESGVKVTYEIIRGKIKALLERFLRLALDYMYEIDSKKPFSVDDFRAVVDRYGAKKGINEDGDCRGEDGDCSGEDGRQRRQFKQPDIKQDLLLQKTCFFRLVQEIMQDLGRYMTFTQDAKIVLQQYTEQYVITFFKRAKELSENDKRKTVLVRDLNLVRL